ncbi:hypothetical protein NFK79_06210 [Citrobacter freundii]|nr:hypothetical protein [Citrobacter freundii]WFZ86081.1 hypothetical protein NFK79_06210 [Citrobacter freundii]
MTVFKFSHVITGELTVDTGLVMIILITAVLAVFIMTMMALMVMLPTY